MTENPYQAPEAEANRRTYSKWTPRRFVAGVVVAVSGFYLVAVSAQEGFEQWWPALVGLPMAGYGGWLIIVGTKS